MTATLLAGSGCTPEPEAGPKRVFVTSQVFDGYLYSGTDTGLAGGDALCNEAASDLGGRWVAWLSDAETDAIDRIRPGAGAGPWLLVDDTTVVFDDKAAMTSTPQAPIDLDELGNFVGNAEVWTGTHVGGTRAVGNCLNWTDNDPPAAAPAFHPATGRFGSTSRLDGQWTDAAEMGCHTLQHLYCVEL